MMTLRRMALQLSKLEDDNFACHVSPISNSPRRWPAQRRANIGQDIDLCNANRTGSVVWFTNFTQVAVQSRLIATRPIMLQRPAVCGKTLN